MACTGFSLAQTTYPDGRPSATLRLDAKDHGVVLRHGDGPGKCDYLGAREALIFEEKGVYHLFYDGAGPKGWLARLAISKDLKSWEKKGPILDFGKPGESDSAAACAPWVYFDGNEWHMFYLGTPNTSGAPHFIPSFTYLTLKARSRSLAGAWIKQPEVVPFTCQPKTYYDVTASPGHIVKQGDRYLMFFSAAAQNNRGVLRTLSIARTKDLNGPWAVDPQPIVSPEEQIENSSLYFEKSNKTWFLFTNHIGLDGGEYTDAVWVYWSKDLNPIFSAPKPFTNPQIATIQRNAIQSWAHLGEQVEVLLVGQEEGLAEVAAGCGIKHLPDVERNDSGTPLVSSIFRLARQAGQGRLLAYVNADILLLPDVVQAAKHVSSQLDTFLIVGQRWDLDVRQSIDFSPDWDRRLSNEVCSRGELHAPAGSDYFVFPRSAFTDMPDFSIGRAGWNNWAIYHAVSQRWAVVDISPSVMVIHQNHDYSHLPDGKPHYNQEESFQDQELAGGLAHM